eukprot:m.40786 g.40786  ORF g.40786 m.40786 type:complete len:111 (+) comp8130_c0_seq1:1034-1366(+)
MNPVHTQHEMPVTLSHDCYVAASEHGTHTYEEPVALAQVSSSYAHASSSYAEPGDLAIYDQIHEKPQEYFEIVGVNVEGSKSNLFRSLKRSHEYSHPGDLSPEENDEASA